MSDVGGTNDRSAEVTDYVRKSNVSAPLAPKYLNLSGCRAARQQALCAVPRKGRTVEVYFMYLIPPWLT